jgi:hypothetical protein
MAGRDTKAQKGFINPPVVHGSTALYPNAANLLARRRICGFQRRLVGAGASLPGTAGARAPAK